jgi:hypothetical protein
MSMHPLIATSCAALVAGGLAAAPGPPLDPAPAVDRIVEELAPTPEERRFDEIGWARDIRDGRRLSRESGRPLFLFTHDGRMAVGRC